MTRRQSPSGMIGGLLLFVLQQLMTASAQNQFSYSGSTHKKGIRGHEFQLSSFRDLRELQLSEASSEGNKNNKQAKEKANEVSSEASANGADDDKKNKKDKNEKQDGKGATKKEDNGGGEKDEEDNKEEKKKEENVLFSNDDLLVIKELHPIVFDIAENIENEISNDQILQTYFQGFIEDILNMRSNRDWFPLHEKSVGGIAIDLVQCTGNSDIWATHGNEDDKAQQPLQLIITGEVLVHSLDYKDGYVVLPQRTARTQKKQTIIMQNETASDASFYDSFDHSMLLYLSFWGPDSIQTVLQQVTGREEVTITSVTVGEKKLITFGIDKDDNFLYGGQHDEFKPKQKIEGRNSGTSYEKASSSAVPGSGLISVFVLTSFRMLIGFF